jgi:NADPH2:quinone reductase
MKAVMLYEFGSPDQLRYETVVTPVPQKGQVLIKVESASVNFADVMRRRNSHYPFPTPLPVILGSEVAGTIESVGEGVTQWQVGMPVFALVGSGGSSGYAQYAVADASQVIPIPPSLSADEACALVVAGSAALLIIKEVARLQPHESIFIPAASGGFGGYAIQLAKHYHAGKIIAGASTPQKRQIALANGADAVVDYTQANWSQQVRDITEGRGVDVALEMIGGEMFNQTLDSLAPFGRLIVYGNASSEPLEMDSERVMRTFYDPSPNQSIHVFNLGLWFGLQPEKAGQALGELIGLAANGVLKISVDHKLPLSQANTAHRLLEERKTTGKVVLKPWQDA